MQTVNNQPVQPGKDKKKKIDREAIEKARKDRGMKVKNQEIVKK